MVNRLVASQYLNTIADVISAVNLAYDVNYTNSNSYLNDYVERENSVEVFISMGDHPPAGIKKFYLMEPDSRTKSKFVYYFDSVPNTDASDSARSQRINLFKTTNITAAEVSCYNLLKSLNDTKLVVDDDGQRYTIYKYYFKANCITDAQTGKVNSVRFNLIEDTSF